MGGNGGSVGGKAISGGSSAEVSKSIYQDTIYLAVNLFRVPSRASLSSFLVPKLYLGVQKMCKKFHEVPTVGCNHCRGNNLTTPPNLL